MMAANKKAKKDKEDEEYEKSVRAEVYDGFLKAKDHGKIKRSPNSRTKVARAPQFSAIAERSETGSPVFLDNPLPYDEKDPPVRSETASAKWSALRQEREKQEEQRARRAKEEMHVKQVVESVDKRIAENTPKVPPDMIAKSTDQPPQLGQQDLPPSCIPPWKLGAGDTTTEAMKLPALSSTKKLRQQRAQPPPPPQQQQEPKKPSRLKDESKKTGSVAPRNQPTADEVPKFQQEERQLEPKAGIEQPNDKVRSKVTPATGKDMKGGKGKQSMAVFPKAQEPPPHNFPTDVANLSSKEGVSSAKTGTQLVNNQVQRARPEQRTPAPKIDGKTRENPSQPPSPSAKMKKTPDVDAKTSKGPLPNGNTEMPRADNQPLGTTLQRVTTTPHRPSGTTGKIELPQSYTVKKEAVASSVQSKNSVRSSNATASSISPKQVVPDHKATGMGHLLNGHAESSPDDSGDEDIMNTHKMASGAPTSSHSAEPSQIDPVGENTLDARKSSKQHPVPGGNVKEPSADIRRRDQNANAPSTNDGDAAGLLDLASVDDLFRQGQTLLAEVTKSPIEEVSTRPREIVKQLLEKGRPQADALLYRMAISLNKLLGDVLSKADAGEVEQPLLELDILSDVIFKGLANKSALPDSAQKPKEEMYKRSDDVVACQEKTPAVVKDIDDDVAALPFYSPETSLLPSPAFSDSDSTVMEPSTELPSLEEILSLMNEVMSLQATPVASRDRSPYLSPSVMPSCADIAEEDEEVFEDTKQFGPQSRSLQRGRSVSGRPKRVRPSLQPKGSAIMSGDAHERERRLGTMRRMPKSGGGKTAPSSGGPAKAAATAPKKTAAGGGNKPSGAKKPSAGSKPAKQTGAKVSKSSKAGSASGLSADQPQTVRPATGITGSRSVGATPTVTPQFSKAPPSAAGTQPPSAITANTPKSQASPRTKLPSIPGRPKTRKGPSASDRSDLSKPPTTQRVPLRGRPTSCSQLQSIAPVENTLRAMHRQVLLEGEDASLPEGLYPQDTLQSVIRHRASCKSCRQKADRLTLLSKIGQKEPLGQDELEPIENPTTLEDIVHNLLWALPPEMNDELKHKWLKMAIDDVYDGEAFQRWLQRKRNEQELCQRTEQLRGNNSKLLESTQPVTVSKKSAATSPSTAEECHTSKFSSIQDSGLVAGWEELDKPELESKSVMAAQSTEDAKPALDNSIRAYRALLRYVLAFEPFAKAALKGKTQMQRREALVNYWRRQVLTLKRLNRMMPSQELAVSQPPTKKTDHLYGIDSVRGMNRGKNEEHFKGSIEEAMGKCNEAELWASFQVPAPMDITSEEVHAATTQLETLAEQRRRMEATLPKLKTPKKKKQHVAPLKPQTPEVPKATGNQKKTHPRDQASTAGKKKSSGKPTSTSSSKPAAPDCVPKKDSDPQVAKEQTKAHPQTFFPALAKVRRRKDKKQEKRLEMETIVQRFTNLEHLARLLMDYYRAEYQSLKDISKRKHFREQFNNFMRPPVVADIDHLASVRLFAPDLLEEIQRREAIELRATEISTPPMPPGQSHQQKTEEPRRLPDEIAMKDRFMKRLVACEKEECGGRGCFGKCGLAHPTPEDIQELHSETGWDETENRPRMSLLDCLRPPTIAELEEYRYPPSATSILDHPSVTVSVPSLGHQWRISYGRFGFKDFLPQTMPVKKEGPKTKGESSVSLRTGPTKYDIMQRDRQHHDIMMRFKHGVMDNDKKHPIPGRSLPLLHPNKHVLTIEVLDQLFVQAYRSVPSPIDRIREHPFPEVGIDEESGES